MKVSFIIPLYNCLAHTRECLRTLTKSLPRGLEHEIIFVDDGSTDGTREWLARLAQHTVILNDHNLGYAAANNRAAARASGDLLCLINNDLVFRPGWLEPMLRLHARLGSHAGAVGNIQRRVSDRAIDHAGIFINAKAKPEHDRNWYPWPRQWRCVPAVTGACLLLDRKLFLEVGGFDCAFSNGGEDVDLCFRLARRGLFHAVALRSTVLHHVSAAPGRKSHDEANSRRLAQKWAAELSELALRQWGWHHLALYWAGSRTPENWVETAELLGYLLHLLPRAPVFAINGVRLTMAREMKRWRDLLDGD